MQGWLDWDAPCPRASSVSASHVQCSSPPAPWDVLCKSGPPTFKTTPSTLFLTSCNCSVTLKCPDLQNSPCFSVLSALFPMQADFCLESLNGLPSQGRTLWKNVCTAPFQITLLNHLYKLKHDAFSGNVQGFLNKLEFP